MDIEKQKEFLMKYKELSEEYNMEIVAIPRWMRRDDGTFSMVVDMVIGEHKPDATNNIPK